MNRAMAPTTAELTPRHKPLMLHVDEVCLDKLAVRDWHELAVFTVATHHRCTQGEIIRQCWAATLHPDADRSKSCPAYRTPLSPAFQIVDQNTSSDVEGFQI
jgi:hypothetical protein